MSLREKQSKFVLCVAKAIVWAYEHGYELTWGDTYPGKFPHKANGKHPEGLAIDLNLFRDGLYLDSTEDWAPIGHYYESLDPKATWGGRFGDGNHLSWGEGR